MSPISSNSKRGVDTVNLSSLKVSEIRDTNKQDLAEMEFFDPNQVVVLSSASREWKNIQQNGQANEDIFEEDDALIIIQKWKYYSSKIMIPLFAIEKL